MSTATAEPQVYDQSNDVVETVIFQSKSPNQTLTRIPERYVDNGMGGRKVLKREDVLAEEAAVNRHREAKGLDPNPIDDAPWRIEFKGSRFVVPNDIPSVSPEGQRLIIAWLRSHPKLNFNGPSGFIEVERPPADREPTSKEQLREVEQSLLHRDLPRAEACLQVEEETHRRPDVLQAAVAAVTGIREVLGADGVQDAVPGNEGPPSTAAD